MWGRHTVSVATKNHNEIPLPSQYPPINSPASFRQIMVRVSEKLGAASPTTTTKPSPRCSVNRPFDVTLLRSPSSELAERLFLLRACVCDGRTMRNSQLSTRPTPTEKHIWTEQEVTLKVHKIFDDILMAVTTLDHSCDNLTMDWPDNKTQSAGMRFLRSATGFILLDKTRNTNTVGLYVQN
jgi:hypothetical protein